MILISGIENDKRHSTDGSSLSGCALFIKQRVVSKGTDGRKVVLFQIMPSIVLFFEKRSHYAHTKEMKIENAKQIEF